MFVSYPEEKHVPSVFQSSLLEKYLELREKK
jgi:hypothetical protein